MLMERLMSNLVLVLGVLLLGVAGAVYAEGAATDDAAAIAKRAEAYPLTTCVISGGKLGSMGAPVDYLHEGHLVRFCCKGCIKTFNADPAKYLKMIDEAAKAKADGASAPAEVEAGTSVKKATSGCGSGCGGCGAAVKPAAGGCGGCGTEGSAPKKASGGCGGCGK